MNVKRKCRICQTVNPDDFRGSKMKSKCNVHRNSGIQSLEYMDAMNNQQTVRKLWQPRNPQKSLWLIGLGQVYQQHALDNLDMSITP